MPRRSPGRYCIRFRRVFTHTYNRRRRQRALGKLTPVEYELAFTTQAAIAA
jgi:transposase InsO family protein